MNVLLTNDDGIDAPGLTTLHRCVTETLGDQVSQLVVVAPDRGRSECSHSVTTGEDLYIEEIRPGWFALNGTPVDCLRAALFGLKFEPDFVLSGVNAGANLGVNLMVSGTFAAARESATLGVPAMAVSHYRRHDVAKTWDHVPRWVEQTLKEFAEVALRYRQAKNVTDEAKTPPLWNVNLPAVDPSTPSVPRERCPVDCNPITRTATIDEGRVVYELDFHGRPRSRGSDVERCFAGSLTISDLSPFFRTLASRTSGFLA
ncbi:5'/3'-nucleotidase SurE [Stieleria varia]|uniref:5'-nucleotidase n=1 Tax=Stieleria varia TaxID=2528005 RepID=A0A5C6AYK9_9BACT|nr:5'/3'-nucleotidase SurE [Stieleria varia]TWU05063.1 5'-nucleotidase SurE [Stieleria varia]